MRRSPAKSSSREGGFALPVAIFALVIALTVIAGSAFVARQETKIGSAVRMGSEAFYLAEAGINEVMLDWSVMDFQALPLWSDTTIVDTMASGLTTTRVTRVDDRLFLIESLSDVTMGGAMLAGASREAGMMVHLFSPQIMTPAALTTRGSVAVIGNAEVHGEDLDPAEWGGFCSGNLKHQAGILVDDASKVTTGGSGQITGNPAVIGDPNLSDSTFTEFGGMNYAEMVALADKTAPTGVINNTLPVVSGTTCDTGVSTNWGDPLNPNAPCGDYFPLVHVPGSLRIQSGGVGQGILLVDGDLELRGGFVFYGIVIIQGNLETQGNGNKVYGGVLASNATIEAQTLTGASVIEFSSCATERAVMNNLTLTRPRPLGQRSWVDLSAIRN